MILGLYCVISYIAGYIILVGIQCYKPNIFEDDGICLATSCFITSPIAVPLSLIVFAIILIVTFSTICAQFIRSNILNWE